MANVTAEFEKGALAFLGSKGFACNYTPPAQGNVALYVFEDLGEMGLALRNAQMGENPCFSAYYLPYSDNATHSLRLGGDAKYMITPALTGCTFIVDNKWNNPTVGHLNWQGHDGTIDQDRIDQEVANTPRFEFPTSYRGVVANYYAVKKADYVPEGEHPQAHRLFIMGIRYKLGWYFYRVKHKPVGLGEVEIEGPTRIN